jgi:hypothetical protein
MQRVAHLGEPLRHRTVVCIHRVTPQITDLSLNAGDRRPGTRPCSLYSALVSVPCSFS